MANYAYVQDGQVVATFDTLPQSYGNITGLTTLTLSELLQVNWYPVQNDYPTNYDDTLFSVSGPTYVVQATNVLEHYALVALTPQQTAAIVGARLLQAKKLKLSNLALFAQQQISVGFALMGFDQDTLEREQLNALTISSSILATGAGALAAGLVWVDENGDVHTLTNIQYTQFIATLNMFTAICRQNTRTHVTAIVALTTLTDVVNYDFTVNWPAGFTGVADPSVIGEEANVGSFLLRTDTLDIFFKTGPNLTDWIMVPVAPQLQSFVTPGTYNSVTVNANGRVVAGSNPTTLAGYGIVNALRNLGGAPGLMEDTFANRPAAGLAGRLFLATDTNAWYRDNGTSWDLVSTGGGGGGTPAGANTQLQYNNGGAFGASPNFTFDPTTNTLSLTGQNTEILMQGITNEPAAPPTGQLLLYTKSFGGRMMPKWVGPAGVDTPVQAHFGFNRIMQVAPASGTTAASAMQAVGTAFTNTGTISNPTPTSTNLKSSTRRTNFSTSTTAGNVASNRCNVLECWRGNAVGLGGFFYVVRFSLNTLVAGNRAFFGLTDTIGAPSNIDPTTSTTNAKVGMAINTNTGNWNIIINTAGSAPTIVALDANFPVDTTSFYELILFAGPNDSSISYRVTNLSTNNQTSGTFNTNMPANTAFLAPMHWITNNATAAAAIMALHRWYLETDN